VIFVVFIPHYLITGSLKLGAFYNLMSPKLVTTTTVEAPLIAGILFLLSAFDFFFNKNFSFINVVSIVFSFLILLLFSRRGFIFSSVISLLLYYLYLVNRSKYLIYTVFLLLFLPMFWDVLSVFVVSFFKIDLFSDLIARSNSDELVSATGRMYTWNNILDLFFSFKSKFIFGIKGGPPESLFLISDEGNRYNQAHNTFLQMFLEGGYFMNCFFLVMLIKEFKFYTNNKSHKQNHFFACVIYLFSISATETIIVGINFSNFIFCFVFIGFIISNRFNHITTRRV
jgi:hypothetical protein